jgi:GntR family transcriptional regulator
VLSREIKINPNTAHKVITQLIASGLLETQPGIGTVVSELPEARRSERVRLLKYEIEQLVVEAKKLGIGLDEVTESVSEHWKDLSHDRSNRGGTNGR